MIKRIFKKNKITLLFHKFLYYIRLYGVKQTLYLIKDKLKQKRQRSFNQLDSGESFDVEKQKINNDDFRPEPWYRVNLEDRLNYLGEILDKEYKINVIIYEKADSAAFRYRVYNVYQNLKQSKKWKAVYFFYNEIKFVLDRVQYMSMITFVRTRWNEIIDHLIIKAKSFDIPVIFDIDDCVCKLEYMPLVTKTINVDMSTDAIVDYWTSYIGRLELVAQKADGFIATNKFLGNILKKHFKKEYKVIHNFLNDEQIRVSQEYTKRNKENKTDKFVIGYFSGTPTHINDFKIIQQELICLMEQYHNIQLKVVGFTDFTEDMLHFKTTGQLIFSPFVDFITLQRIIADVDLNIVPLVKNDFTDCKSELKFFEAAVVKTPTCASPSYVYKTCIKDGENGFLCQPGMWYSRILDIYSNKVDINGVNDKAYEYVNKFYYGSYITEKIEEAYDFFTSNI